MQVEVLLNRVYDLSRPGKYMIQALRSDNGVTAKSNILTFSFAGVKHEVEKAKPRFSVTLTTPYNTVKAGYQAPVKIAVRNISKEKID